MRIVLGFLLMLLIASLGLSQPGIIEANATVTTTPIAPDGTEIQLDLPPELHMRNTGGSDGPRGPGSGSGLCVMTAINHAAYWQNVEAFFDFQKWAMQRPGGGWPEKIDNYMQAVAAEKGVPTPRYLQIVSRDLSLIRAAFESGRMVSITYCRSPAGRYGGARIAHMVTLLHLDSKWACVMDNNFPRTYEWMSPDTLLSVAACGNGRYWAHVFLDPGPPPVPVN